MLKIAFTAEEIRRLGYERYPHRHPRVQRRMAVVYLKALGLPHQKISRVAGVGGNTLRRYWRAYQAGGIERFKEIRFRRPHSALLAHPTSREGYFRDHPPASVKAVAAKRGELTGIQRRPNRGRLFLKRLGMERCKVATILAKAEVETQQAFKQTELEPRLDEARAGKRAIFSDAAQVALTPFLGFPGSFGRLFIKAPAGRQRFKVLGALNALTYENFTLFQAAITECLGKVRTEYTK